MISPEFRHLKPRAECVSWSSGYQAAILLTAAKSLAGPLVNFAFTWAGLSALLSNDAQLDLEAGRRELDFAFTDQTPEHVAVSDQLGFIDRSAPANWWEKHFTNADIHMAVYAAFDNPEQAARSLADIRESAARSGLVELRLPAFADGALSGCRPEGGILHFGYRDGITSPNIDWSDSRDPAKVNFREFLMGYPSDDYPVAPQKCGPWQDFARNGSFACLAWIHQDTAAFNRFLDANVTLASNDLAPGLKRDWLAAQTAGTLARRLTAGPPPGCSPADA